MAANGASMPEQIDSSGASFSGPMSNQAVTNSKLRKRTKTGCLTCRKRRIKCGEERPSCNNCFKSKRHCEGYNQRVIFKPPIGDWPGAQHDSPTGTLQYHNGMLPPSIAQYRPVPPPINTQDAGFTPLQPRPGQALAFDENGHPIQFAPPSAGLQYAPGPNGLSMVSPHTPLPPSWTPITPQYPGGMYAQPSPMSATSYHSQHSQLPTPSQSMPGSLTSPFSLSPNADPAWQRPQYSDSSQEVPTPVLSVQQDYKPSFYESPLIPTPGSSTQSQDGETHQLPVRHSEVPIGYWDSSNTDFPHTSGHEVSYSQSTSEALSWTRPQAEQSISPSQAAATDSPHEIYTQPHAPIPQSASLSGARYVGGASDLLEQAAVETMDDDYFDVHSDEEMDISPGETVAKLQENQRDFGMIVNLHREHTSDLSMRRYDTFIYAGILDHYRAEWVANPLRNPKTARVFAHFIFATGPTVSIFERHSRNASAMFSEHPVPNHQQGLWTYTLPMMALNHQGLLHAMLALSSLHIAKLQGASITPSYKHYAYAIKRIHHCVGNPKKKLLPTTLAATLLLGFYEVMTADHLKWSSHLAGAKQLIIEIPFRRITREVRKRRAEQATQEDDWGFQFPGQALQARNPNLTFRDLTPAIDEGLVSTLIGRKLSYDDYGHIIEEGSDTRSSASGIPQELDLSKYELYQDLFWWYARQDVYQAIISGNRLLLDYSRWSDCPPRASMGRPDAVHGTHDHLILLLARIADFSARDRRRKLRSVEANGGQWRPHPDMNMGPPPQNQPPSNPAHAANPQSNSLLSQPGNSGPPQGPLPAMPQFYGMAPMPVTPRMPSSYASQGYNSTPSPTSDRSDYDLGTATQAALEEWHQIKSALNIFRSHFGPQYQPLDPELHQPIHSPFGPAIVYRSHDIANLWGLYYMSYIIALRSHPHMPPAAMLAAGVAARQTAEFSQIIGRIAGGIVPPHAGQELNPSLGASLCEISMPLFFAGIQFQDHSQRSWLVHHLRNIEARTGWGSVGMIAQGCETSWVKTYEAGRGPPWERTKQEWHIDARGDNRVKREDAGERVGDTTSDGIDMSDRKWASTNPATRVHWAMGLLSVEEDEDLASSP